MVEDMTTHDNRCCMSPTDQARNNHPHPKCEGFPDDLQREVAIQRAKDRTGYDSPIILPGGHVAYQCTTKHNADDTYTGNCQFCDGGLSACAICGAFEGAWTTDCAGIQVLATVWNLVYEGSRDYRKGKGGWVDAGSPYSPSGRRRIEYEIQRAVRALGYDHVEFHVDPPADDVKTGRLAGYELATASPDEPDLPSWWMPEPDRH